jgi:hypothetical protein
MNTERLTELREELKRFDKRLNAYEKKLSRNQFAAHGCTESGELKRAALDFKLSLTRNITKSL